MPGPTDLQLGPPSDIARPASSREASTWRDLAELSKPGIVRLVTVTSGVGLALGAIARGTDAWTLWQFVVLASATLAGTACSAAGANALNQVWESDRDALMHRTRERPVAAGRVSRAQGAWFGVAASVLGVAILLAGAGAWAAAVSLVTIVSYVLIYTPMKPVSAASTWVGAVPGALPPMIGWAAASPGEFGGLLRPGGWTVFAIMFAWQIPHFLAIAWKYREDYARGGYKVMSVDDPGGSRTAWTSFWWTLVMIAVSMTPVWALGPRVAWFYGACALLAGLGMLRLAVHLVRHRTDAAARGLFLGSLAYLPLILILLVADAALPPMR